MKRFVILAALLVAGAAAAVVYAALPKETVMVALEEDEDGSPVLVQVAQTAAQENAENEKAVKSVSFSLEAGFYSENISVELSAAKGAEIYFTMDGSDPDENSTLYTAPIEINATSTVNATTIKAIATANGEKSEIATRSFVVGKDVAERFDDETLVFVLSTDPYNLYDYEYGIAVPGKIYDDYVAEHKGEEIPYNAPGNYFMSGREAERDIYVEVFDSAGDNVISQGAGVRIVGGYSRVVDQKSLKLIARKEYDPDNGKFKYAFFPDAVTSDGAPISEYDRIVLRNGANDREFAGVRDELSQQLARDYGYPTTQHTVPAAVFLNGEYYGYAWLHENYNEDYLATQFGGNKEQYEIISNTEQPEEGSEQALADYAEVVEYFTERDLTDNKTFEEFCKLVDIDNLIQYYAMQIFISNKDWPGNNYKIYRYYPEEGEEITNEKMDGRWRYLFFDAEYAWGLYGDGYALKTLSDLLSGNHMSGASDMLIALLEREDMREKLANTICDLTADAFSAGNILATLDELIEKSDNEQMYALKNGITSTWANEWSFEESRQQIRDFANNRSWIVLRDIAKNFDYEQEYYEITVTGAKGANVSLSTQTTVGGVISASYFTQCSVNVSADVFDDYEFVKWEINGKEFFTRDLTITSNHAQNGKVSVKLYIQPREISGEPLRISEISTDKGAGWIKLYNPNEESISTDGLYLTDGEENLTRWALPTLTIEPKSELIIVMKNNKTTDALMQVQANFSLKAGETLILSNNNGKVLASVPIPKLEQGSVYALLDSGKYGVKE